MVGVAQLAERCVVVADVAGSSPVTHPIESVTDRLHGIAGVQAAGFAVTMMFD